MEVFRSDVKTGLFILTAVVLFLFGIFKVGGLIDGWKSSNELIINTENAEQVTPGTEVLFRGKKVGQVKEVRFSRDGDSIDIFCRILPEITIYQGTQARIDDKSALGGKVIDLLPPLETGNQDPLGDGDRIPGLPSAGLTALIGNLNETLLEFKGKVGRIVDKLDLLLDRVDLLAKSLQEQVEVIGEVTPNLNQTLEQYQQLARGLEQDLKQLTTKIADELDVAAPAAVGALNEVKSLTVGLKADMSRLTLRLDRFLEGAENLLGQGESILVENRADLEETIQGLKIASRDLKTFSAKIAAQPSLVLRKGKTPTPNLSDDEAFVRELRETGQIGRKGNKKKD